MTTLNAAQTQSENSNNNGESPRAGNSVFTGGNNGGGNQPPLPPHVVLAREMAEIEASRAAALARGEQVPQLTPSNPATPPSSVVTDVPPWLKRKTDGMDLTKLAPPPSQSPAPVSLGAQHAAYQHQAVPAQERSTGPQFISPPPSAVMQTQQVPLAAPRPAETQGPMRIQSIEDSVREEYGLHVPNELVPLPSRGILYDPRLSIFNKETIEIRPMTTREEDLLTNRALIKKGTIITELIKSCITDRMIDPGDMIAGDRVAVLYGIRMSSYGHEYKAEVTCSAEDCGRRLPRTFDLSKLEIKFLELEPISRGVNLFSFTLPKTGIPVQFKFLTGNDEEEVSTTLERMNKLTQASNTVTMNLQHSIVSVKGKTDRASINRFISQMPAFDSSALRKHMSTNQPGIKTSQLQVCPACGFEEEVDMPMGVSFLWPNAG